LLLVRSPLTGAGVSLGTAFGATLPFAAIAIALMRLVLRSRAWQVQTGVEELVHEVGRTTTAIESASGTPQRGMVRIHGELWQARSAGPIPAGARVRVVRIDGLTLDVEPLDGRSGTSASGEDGR
jgi:membrane-bound serine protease (ClpP class)